MRNMSNPMEGAPQDILPEIDSDILLQLLGSDFSSPQPPSPPLDFQLPGPAPMYPPLPESTAPVLVPRGTGPQPQFLVSELRPSSVGMASSQGSAASRGSRGTQGNARSGQEAARTQMQAQTGAEPEGPMLVIVEQPKERGMRFRYECEGRSAGSILGASSTEKNKTLPTIEIQGNVENVKDIKVTVSLVTKDNPYRPHPHCLVGKGCYEGICVVHINPRATHRHSFSNLGVQCVRRKEMDAALEKRRSQNIDPFNTGHTKSIEDIDMNVVRLCFQAEVEREDGETVSLGPVLSSPIYDNKATITSELKIYRLNVSQGPCTGKTEIYMLCDKVQKDDIEIIFSHDGWEARAEFVQTDVHRQIAIIFKSPPYQELDISKEVEVNVTLHRLSDGMDSEPVKFTYLPHNPDPYEINRKRKIRSERSANVCNIPAQNLALPEPSAPLLFDPYVFGISESTGLTTAPLPAGPPLLTTPTTEGAECPYAALLAQVDLTPEQDALVYNLILRNIANGSQELFPSNLSTGQQDQQNGDSDYTFCNIDVSAFIQLTAGTDSSLCSDEPMTDRE
ncbi:transcription factor RelB-like [Megalops cyprinoides]|uniref:transcription factor RelB-like n=1 Tax=Megalops cyprinoides TaxID=118141 RepID=UPI0018651A3F|nr:transcription factor RelB-like [Megalops cyprinoides]